MEAGKTKKLLNNRAEINLLVKAFYAKVRKDELLGPVFNSQVKDWPEHLERLTDFWETNLFFVRAYKGNPLQAHIAVDKHFNHSIHQAHFGHWLQLWFETLDELFQGRNTELAKERARKMAHVLFMRIFEARNNKQSHA